MSERETPRIGNRRTRGLPESWPLSGWLWFRSTGREGLVCGLPIRNRCFSFVNNASRASPDLARLEEVKGDRWLRVGLFLEKNRQAPALAIARIGDDLFRLTPNRPCHPGNICSASTNWQPRSTTLGFGTGAESALALTDAARISALRTLAGLFAERPAKCHYPSEDTKMKRFLILSALVAEHHIDRSCGSAIQSPSGKTVLR